jgi:hypothetical protein
MDGERQTACGRHRSRSKARGAAKIQDKPKSSAADATGSLS